MKRILILGGSGRTGNHAIEHALSKALEVVALVRKPIPTRPGLSQVQGTPESLSDVKRAIQGCDAVLICLSPRSGDNPFTMSNVVPNLLTMAATNALTAMKANDVRRIVYLSAWGVAESWPELPGVGRWFLGRTNIKPIFVDHANAEAMMETSGLDWTSVRPPALTNGGPSRTRMSERGVPKPSLFLSRRALSKFMVDSLPQRELFGKAITVSREA